mmetsp:Transcript_58/g.197  ORF Transcript_58/g.197 Transcript_58/m.197 type:complete len:220 (-) Transcript_58:12-671(-)
MLVHSSADDARRQARNVAGSVNGRWADDDPRQAVDLLHGVLGLELVLGEVGPRRELRLLLARLLALRVHLCGRRLDVLVGAELGGRGGDLLGEREHLLGVHLLGLAVLGLGGKVEDKLKLALLHSVGLVDASIARQIALLELNDFRVERSGVRVAKEGSRGQNLVHDTDVLGEVVLDKVGDEVAADEANSTKNQHVRLRHLYSHSKTTWAALATNSSGR